MSQRTRRFRHVLETRAPYGVAMTAELTLGAEEELHLIDLTKLQLSARAPQLLARLPSENYSAEIQRTTVETNTEVVTSLSALRDEIVRLRRGVIDVASAEGMGIASVGTAPRSVFADFELTTTGRYGRMQEQYRLLVDEQLICGLQVHVGVADRDQAVLIAQRVAHALPILLALSASSPFWNGQDTGYASFRTIIWQRWPSAGATGWLDSVEDYDALLADLIRSGVIADAKMAYFDVRPSAHVPTVELRVSDACPIVDDAVLIAGLFRAAVRAAEQDVEAGVPFLPVRAPIHRAAMWQAARGGLAGNLLDDTPHPQPVPAPQAVHALVDRLRPQLEELGDWDDVQDLSRAVLARGNSADRQRAAFAERGELDDVVELVVKESQGPAEGFARALPGLPHYRFRAGDEAVSIGSQPRPAYREIVDYFGGLDDDAVAELDHRRRSFSEESGVAFRVDGVEQQFHVDLMPRVISDYEWSQLATGLAQRARAIEAFLQDVYSDQRVLRDGIVPSERVVGSAGWREEAMHLPPGTVHAPIMGFDLVRNEFGGWRVLEDNLRNPSGAAYGIAARELLDAIVPSLPRPEGLVDPQSAPAELKRTLLANAPGNRVAVLSSGPSSSAWFEHRRLAADADMLLTTADDLDVERGVVVHRASRDRIHALYLRLDVELADLEDADGRTIGAEVLEVAASGRVFLGNAPGNGVADDKAMYCYVPELIAYYLDERPLLESVPTYRTSDEIERRIVLERIGELVTKPVDGYGGRDVMIGPSASASEVAERRSTIAADPAGWVAQEVVALSSMPTFDAGRLEPRNVDLRTFVYVTGTGPNDARLADVALTRVAPEGSMVVNSSRGGGAKDTWIIRGTGKD